MSGQLCLKWNNHSNAFNKLLKQIFLEDNNGYSDATILCHGKFYPVHRFVLSTCSEYFEEMFQQCVRLNNKHPFIIVKDIHPEQMEALLSYMYKGEMIVPQENLPELIKAGEAFKIRGLAVPEDEDLQHERKRINSYSGSPLPVPKKMKKSEEISKSASCETSNTSVEPIMTSTVQPISEDYIVPLIRIKTENVGDSISEEISICENTYVKDCIAVKNEKMNTSTSTLSHEDNIEYSYKNPSKLESEPEWEEDFQPFEGEASRDDPSTNRSLDKISASLAIEQVIVEYGNSKMNATKFCSFDDCSYTTEVSSDMKRHVRSHTGEKPFKCDSCPYRATKKEHLIEHRRTHSGEKPFNCHLCSYRASRKDSLNGHIRTHTGEKPYKCAHCSYSSSHRFALRRHLKIHSGNDNEDSI